MEGSVPLRRVTFELPNENVPDLLAALGDFALRHDISLSVGAATAENTEPSLSAEQYNPKFITHIKDPDSGEQIAVVSRENLQSFAVARDGHPTTGTRIYNAMILRGSCHLSPELSEDTYTSMIVESEGNKFLRADKVYRLLSELRNGNIMFSGISDVSVRDLGDFYGELTRPEALSD